MAHHHKRSLPKLTMIPSGHLAGALQRRLPNQSLWKVPADIISQISALAASVRTQPVSLLSCEDLALYKKIKERTFALNQNNVTRTNAYLQFFHSHPEIKWSFLAHMVSRNAGYYMTDLQGELIPKLLDEKTRRKWFLLLEHSNYMIFHDAFPQLLVYEESKKRKKDLFQLLPFFGVSKIMVPVWKMFFTKKNSEILPLFLILNEQRYIEDRVLKQPLYQDVLQSNAFYWQEVLNLTHILFPAGQSLYGMQSRRFSSWRERVEFGGALFKILFSPRLFPSIYEFASRVEHTGSREDFCKKIFSSKRHHSEAYIKERLGFFKLKKGALPIFSPQLLQVWPKGERPFIQKSDWYQSIDECKDSLFIREPLWNSIYYSYFSSLHKLELSVLAHEWLSKGKRELG